MWYDVKEFFRPLWGGRKRADRRQKVMEEQFSRTEMLLGPEAMERLAGARVAVFGIGGVGGHAAEALVRSGVGALTLVDHDRVSLSNLNRQIIAVHSTLGMYKVDAMRERALDINPRAEIEARRCFFLPENDREFDFTRFDYVVDAVDNVTAKLLIIRRAREAGTPVISAMGAGNKRRPDLFRVARIEETSVCPLARVMRRELRRLGITGVKVVFSTEQPMKAAGSPQEGEKEGRPAPGSLAFVPAAAGLLLAGEVVLDLAGVREEN